MSKVTILLSSLRGGGTERQTLTLAHALSRRGWDLDLVLVNSRDSAYTVEPGLRAVDLHAARVRRALPALIRYLWSARPAVVFSAETHVNVLAILACALSGSSTRLIVSERNHLSSVAHHAGNFLDRMRPVLARFLYPRADLIVAVSKSVADDLQHAGHLPRVKIQTIFNMFDVDDIVRQSSTESPALRQPGDPPVILSAGRLTKQKDHATLMRAFSIVRAARPCRLVILGDGPERPALQRLAESLGLVADLKMPGFVSNPYAEMATSSLFVLSSAWEGLSGVLIEAMACGVPVVSTDCPGGSAEILENGRYGPLTPVGNAEALAEAIIKTLADPISPEALRNRARDFSVERLLPQFIELLDPKRNPGARGA